MSDLIIDDEKIREFCKALLSENLTLRRQLEKEREKRQDAEKQFNELLASVTALNLSNLPVKTRKTTEAKGPSILHDENYHTHRKAGGGSRGFSEQHLTLNKTPIPETLFSFDRQSQRRRVPLLQPPDVEFSVDNENQNDKENGREQREGKPQNANENEEWENNFAFFRRQQQKMLMELEQNKAHRQFEDQTEENGREKGNIHTYQPPQKRQPLAPLTRKSLHNEQNLKKQEVSVDQQLTVVGTQKTFASKTPTRATILAQQKPQQRQTFLKARKTEKATVTELRAAKGHSECQPHFAYFLEFDGDEEDEENRAELRRSILRGTEQRCRQMREASRQRAIIVANRRAVAADLASGRRAFDAEALQVLHNDSSKVSSFEPEFMRRMRRNSAGAYHRAVGQWREEARRKQLEMCTNRILAQSSAAISRMIIGYQQKTSAPNGVQSQGKERSRGRTMGSSQFGKNGRTLDSL